MANDPPMPKIKLKDWRIRRASAQEDPAASGITDSQGHWLYVFFAFVWGLSGVFIIMPHSRWLTALYIAFYFLCIAGLAAPRLPFSIPGLRFIRRLFYEEVPRINAPPAYALRLWSTLAASVLLLLYIARAVLVLVQLLQISRGA